MKHKKTVAGDEPVFESFRGLAVSIRSLNQEALGEHAPVVEGIPPLVLPILQALPPATSADAALAPGVA